MSNPLREIEALGQSIWIDNISRQLLDDGIMRRLIEEDGISGVTSNPTIFEKAMGHSDRYDDAFRETLDETRDARGDLRAARLPRHPRRRRPAAADVRQDRRRRTDTCRSRCRRRSPSTPTKTIEAAQRYKAEIDRPTC